MASECVTATTTEAFGGSEEPGLRARSKSTPTVHHETCSSLSGIEGSIAANGVKGGQAMTSAGTNLAGASPSSSVAQTGTASNGRGHFSHGLHHARSFDHLSPFHPSLGQSQQATERLGAWAATPSFTPSHERQQAISPPANGYSLEPQGYASRERWQESHAPFDPSQFWPAPFLGGSTSTNPPPHSFAPSPAPDARNQPSPTQTGSPQPPSSPEFSIFVGDLSPGVTEEDLVQQFLNPPAWSSSHPAAIAAAQAQQAQGNFTRQPRIAPAPFSSTKSAKIITDPATNVSRGFGFVRFGDEGECNRALVEMQGVVIHPSRPGHGAGRPLRVCTATPKEKSASGSTQAGSPVCGGSVSIAGDTIHYVPTPGAFQGSALGITGVHLPYPSHAQLQCQHEQQQVSHQQQSSPMPLFYPTPPAAFPPRFASAHPGITAPSPASSPPWPTHPPLHQGLPQGLVSVPYGSGFGTPVRSGTPSNAHAARSFGPILSSGGSASQLAAQKVTTPAAVPVPSLAASFAQALAPVIAEAARSSPNSADSASNAAAASDDSNTTVFVGGLSSLISEDTLRTFFAPFGEITYVKIPPGKGCGFVQFVKKSDAARAIERMQSFPIGGGRIRLSWGRSQGDKAAAAAALANAQAAQISHLASLAGLGNLTSSQLAQLAGISDVLSSAQAATTTPGVHSPAPSEGSSRDLLQAAAGAAPWRPAFVMGEAVPLPPPAGASAAAAAPAPGPGPVVSELLAIFARLGIEDNPGMAKKFLDLARSAEAEQIAIYTQQVKLHQQRQLMKSAAKAFEASEEHNGSVRDELTSGVNWLKSSTFSPFASDDAAALLGARTLSSPQQPQQHASSSSGGQQGNENPSSPSGAQTSAETPVSLTRKSSAAQLSSQHGPVSPPHHIHSHSSLSTRSAAGLTSASE